MRRWAYGGLDLFAPARTRPCFSLSGFIEIPPKNGCESPFCAAESGFGVHLRPKSLPYETPTGLYAETERTQKPRSPSEFRKPKVRRHPKAVFMQKHIINKARRYRRCGFASGALRNVLSLKASPAQQRALAQGIPRPATCSRSPRLAARRVFARSALPAANSRSRGPALRSQPALATPCSAGRVRPSRLRGRARPA